MIAREVKRSLLLCRLWADERASWMWYLRDDRVTLSV